MHFSLDLFTADTLIKTKSLAVLFFPQKTLTKKKRVVDMINISRYAMRIVFDMKGLSWHL